jgi:hypothetical protein
MAPMPSFAVPCIISRRASACKNKEDKVSTLRLKPCTDPTAPPAKPRVRGRPPVATIHFRDFPPLGATAARRVHFPLQQPTEPRWELFPLSSRRSRPRSRSARPQPLSADQIRPLGLRPRGLGEPCGGYETTFEGNGSLRDIPIIYRAHAISAHAHGTHTHEILSVTKPV